MFTRGPGFISSAETGRVVLSLHGNGSSVDSSANAYAITASGTAVITTGTFKYGSGCMDCSAALGDRFASPSNAALAPTGVTQVELWFKPTAASLSGGFNFLFSAWPSTNAAGDTAGVCDVYVIGTTLQWLFGSASGSCTHGMVAGTWVHVALAYDGTTAKVYLNDVLATSAVVATPPAAGSYRWDVGGFNTATYTRCCMGYVDDFRLIFSGIRLTGTGSPPTAQLADI